MSAYHAASHDYWLQGLLATFPDYQWRVLTLPPRYFNWRIRGNPLSWIAAESESLNGDYDLLIATSTVDVATLKGLVPGLARCPTALYFHENQFAYPQSSQVGQQRVEPQMVNLYAAIAADQLWFNSAFNRDSFIAGCQALMRALPDHVPDSRWIAALAERACVLPVPLQTVEVLPQPPSDRLRVVWNHRWEYDKGVETFCAAIHQLCDRGIELELTLLGQRFRTRPAAMEGLIKRLERGGDSIELAGNSFIADRADYLSALAAQDVVLSTALHDFQGLAVMEAVQAGCLPLLPDRLCYPEFFGGEYLYAASSESSEAEVGALVEKLSGWIANDASRPSVPDLSPLEWPALRSAYQQGIETLSR